MAEPEAWQLEYEFAGRILEGSPNSRQKKHAKKARSPGIKRELRVSRKSATGTRQESVKALRRVWLNYSSNYSNDYIYQLFVFMLSVYRTTCHSATGSCQQYYPNQWIAVVPCLWCVCSSRTFRCSCSRSCSRGCF